MLLKCNATWIAPDTGSRYEAGNTYDVRDAKATGLCFDAPEGTFEALGQDTPARPRAILQNAEPEVPETTMSAPDRNMRGGQARTPTRTPKASAASAAKPKTTTKKQTQDGGRRPKA